MLFFFFCGNSWFFHHLPSCHHLVKGKRRPHLTPLLNVVPGLMWLPPKGSPRRGSSRVSDTPLSRLPVSFPPLTHIFIHLIHPSHILAFSLFFPTLPGALFRATLSVVKARSRTWPPDSLGETAITPRFSTTELNGWLHDWIRAVSYTHLTLPTILLV